MKSMFDLKIGEQGLVKTVVTEDSMRRRLFDLGLIKGTGVECVLNGGGNEINAYLIRGAVIALRREDAMSVILNG